jgi:hypothetical protein
MFRDSVDWTLPLSQRSGLAFSSKDRELATIIWKCDCAAFRLLLATFQDKRGWRMSTPEGLREYSQRKSIGAKFAPAVTVSRIAVQVLQQILRRRLSVVDVIIGG